MGYIYKITNDINNKSYIGLTTTTVKQRWFKHIRNYKTVDYTLYKAMRKHGVEHFSVQTIEQCDNECLNEREKYYIDLYDTYRNGYNETRGGEGNTLYDRNEIYALWDDGYSVGSIAEQVGSVRSSVYSILWHKTVKGYLWLWEDDKQKINELVKSLDNGHREQKVAQLDKDGNVIAIFNSAKEAAQFFGKLKDSHIGDCCKGRRKTCFGYRWRYER